MFVFVKTVEGRVVGVNLDHVDQILGRVVEQVDGDGTITITAEVRLYMAGSSEPCLTLRGEVAERLLRKLGRPDNVIAGVAEDQVEL